MAAFADVLLRGLNLSGQAIAVGGLVFLLVVWRAAGADRSWRLIALGAAGVAVTQTLALVVLVASLGFEADWHARELLATPFVRASLLRIVASAALMAGWETKTRSAARVTFFSWSRTSRAIKRLRSKRLSCMAASYYKRGVYSADL